MFLYIGKSIANYSQGRFVFGWPFKARVVMLLAPQGRLLEFPGPYAALAAAGISFLTLLIAVGNGPSLLDHPAIKIGFCEIAARQFTAILIPSFLLAANRGFADSRSQYVASLPAAIVKGACPHALLLDLRRVDTLEAYMNLAKDYRVAVDNIDRAGQCLSGCLPDRQIGDQQR